MKEKDFTKEYKESIHNSILKQFEKKGKIIDHYFVDGYFIFHMGQSAVMHFKLDTAPNWKFGVWLDFFEANSKYNSQDYDYIDFEIFAQNELWIDKFKPSASEFKTSGKIVLEQYPRPEKFIEEHFDFYLNRFRLIFDEPYLAFYRHMHYSSFDEVHTSRKEAKKYYKTFIKNEKKESKIEKRYLRKQRGFVRRFFKKLDLEYEIYDAGPNTSPRYDVRIVFNENMTEESAEALQDKFFYEFRSFLKKKTPQHYFRDYISDFLIIYKELDDDEQDM